MRLILIKIFMLTLSLILISLIPHINVYADAPYLTPVGSYYYDRLIDSNPQGRLNLYVDIYRLMNDGNPNYDWYFYVIQIQTVPEKVAYNSDWVTAEHTADHTLASFDAGTNNWFVNYGPTTSNDYYSASTHQLQYPLHLVLEVSLLVLRIHSHIHIIYHMLRLLT